MDLTVQSNYKNEIQSKADDSKQSDIYSKK